MSYFCVGLWYRFSGFGADFWYVFNGHESVVMAAPIIFLTNKVTNICTKKNTSPANLLPYITYYFY